MKAFVWMLTSLVSCYAGVDMMAVQLEYQMSPGPCLRRSVKVPQAYANATLQLGGCFPNPVRTIQMQHNKDAGEMYFTLCAAPAWQDNDDIRRKLVMTESVNVRLECIVEVCGEGFKKSVPAYATMEQRVITIQTVHGHLEIDAAKVWDVRLLNSTVLQLRIVMNEGPSRYPQQPLTDEGPFQHQHLAFNTETEANLGLVRLFYSLGWIRAVVF